MGPVPLGPPGEVEAFGLGVEPVEPVALAVVLGPAVPVVPLAPGRLGGALPAGQIEVS